MLSKFFIHQYALGQAQARRRVDPRTKQPVGLGSVKASGNVELVRVVRAVDAPEGEAQGLSLSAPYLVQVRPMVAREPSSTASVPGKPVEREQVATVEFDKLAVLVRHIRAVVRGEDELQHRFKHLA